MSQFLKKLRSQIPREFFDDKDLRLLMPEMSENALRLAVQRLVRSHDLIRLKKGFYLWSEAHRRSGLIKFAIASKMRSPSYISLESALSYYGLIPEAVYAVTSAHTAHKTKTWNTPLGVFSYQYVPPQAYPRAVLYEKRPDGQHFLIASPLKALFDLVYVTRKVYKSIGDLESDLRLDLDEFRDAFLHVKAEDLRNLARSYRRTMIMRLAELLIREYCS